MKKKFRIAIFMGPKRITPVYQTMCLAFGRENVACSMRPEDLFGILKKLRPTTLIVEPELFYDTNVLPKDILAYQKQIHYHVLAVYSSKESLKIRDKMKDLNAKKEYICPKEYLSMVKEIPALSTNRYVKVKAPLEEYTAKNLDRILRECGFHCNMKGAPLMKEALYMMYFNPNLHLRGGAKTIYLHLSEKYGYTPRIVERSILRFLESSWTPQTEALLRRELNVSPGHSFSPLCFRRFTETFNTYYTIKYRDPEKILSFPRKH
ncbi:MAG: hypothetical protein J6B54_00415 [Clostridia bacterium]|nr:hypothetical protein [Clostridia bacterium]